MTKVHVIYADDLVHVVIIIWQRTLLSITEAGGIYGRGSGYPMTEDHMNCDISRGPCCHQKVPVFVGRGSWQNEDVIAKHNTT